MTQKEIIQKIKQADSLEMIIGVNILFFLFSKIFIAFGWFSLKWVALPVEFNDFVLRPWTLITYGFFHQDFIALFFNMLLLFYFGSILTDFQSKKKLAVLYISGVVLGGLFFMGSYYLFPRMYIDKSPLLGASAGAMAVMTYTALMFPNYQIKIRFLGYFKLIHILIFFVALNLLQIPLGNPGGYFAHFGGLALGAILFFYFNRQKHRTVHTDVYSIPDYKKNTRRQERIDAILDKINRSGYESLTQAEKEELFRQSKK